jgi:hypothetical protein
MRAALPLVTFGEADYLAHGGGDFHDAITAFGEANGLDRRSPLVLGLTGLWGGPGLLSGARDFLQMQLLGAQGTLDNLYAVHRRMGEGRIHVGMHIRRGDFDAPITDGAYAGRFNVRIPVDWYVAVAKSLEAAFGDRLSLLIVTDAMPQEIAPLTDHFHCVGTTDLEHRDVSDMMSLAASDFIVCSISSYSMWAAFFNQGRYAWFAPHLTARGGFASIWGHQENQAHPDAAIPRAERWMQARLDAGESVTERGVAVGMDGILSDALLADIERRFSARQRSSDLIRYGVVRPPTL